MAVSTDRVDGEAIKRNIDLREYVEGDMGCAPKERGGGIVKFNCPFGHRDSDPSFTVWQDHYYCFSCQKTGDLFDYVMARTGKDFKAAVAYITGDTKLPEYKPKSAPIEKKPVKITMQDVERYRANIEWVAEYLRSRKISDAIADIEMLGGARYTHRYLDSNGKEWTFQCNRVALPYVFGDEVYSINFRRDDLSARKWLARMSEQNGMDMAQFVRQDLAKKNGVDPNDLKSEQIMKATFGTRFWRPGTPVTAYGVHNLVFRRGESLVYPRRPYCILTEGEFNQLSCETEFFTCVAAKPVERINFKRLLQNVRLVFLAVDADEAGENYADKIMIAMGSDHTKVRKMILPKGYNDMNDLQKADHLSSFLRSKPYLLDPM